MKLDQALKEAAAIPDRLERGKRIAQVADFMRFKMGLTYAQSVAVAAKCGISADQWEEMMAEADDYRL